MKTELQFHFLRFAIESDSLALAPWLARLYDSNDLEPRFPALARRVRIGLELRDSAHASPIRKPAQGAFAETHLGLGPCYYDAGRFYSENHEHLWHEMEYDLAASCLRANLAGRYADSPQWAVTYVLRTILKGFLMPFWGLATIHAAGVRKGARTILLAGAPAAGKSTAALRFMQAGYDLLSDDRTYVALDGERAWSLSSLDGLHVSDQTLRLFPELAPHIVGERDEGHKWAVGRSVWPPHSGWRDPSPVTDLIQLRRGPVAKPRLIRQSRGAVLEALLREIMVVFRAPAFRAAAFRQYSEFILAAAAAVVRDAELYALEYADADLARLPALVESRGAE